MNWLLKLDPLTPARGKERVYMAGNVMEGFDYDNDNWKAFQNGKEVMDQVRVEEALWPSYVKEESAREAYVRVLAGAGAILPKRDVIDTRISEEVRTGSVHYMGTKAGEWAEDKGNKNNPNAPGIIDTPTDVKDAKDSPVACVVTRLMMFLWIPIMMECRMTGKLLTVWIRRTLRIATAITTAMGTLIWRSTSIR